MRHLVLVDASYTSFYRFFATLRWFSFSQAKQFKEHRDDTQYNWFENIIFKEKYESMYLGSIKKLIGLKNYENSIILFCLDSFNLPIWRAKYLKDYKGSRIDLSLKNNYKPAFNETYNRIIPDLVKNNQGKIFQMQINNLEADDIIGTICKYLDATDNQIDIFLISGDNDFLQLGRPNLFIYSYKSKTPRVLTRTEARQILKQKILTGDISDNISSIFPKDRIRLSIKQRKEIINDKKKLKEYLNEDKEAYKKYKLNQLIIDFDYIPKKFQKLIIKQFFNLNILQKLV